MSKTPTTTNDNNTSNNGGCLQAEHAMPAIAQDAAAGFAAGCAGAAKDIQMRASRRGAAAVTAVVFAVAGIPASRKAQCLLVAKRMGLLGDYLAALDE